MHMWYALINDDAVIFESRKQWHVVSLRDCAMVFVQKTGEDTHGDPQVWHEYLLWAKWRSCTFLQTHSAPGRRRSGWKDLWKNNTKEVKDSRDRQVLTVMVYSGGLHTYFWGHWPHMQSGCRRGQTRHYEKIISHYCNNRKEKKRKLIILFHHIVHFNLAFLDASFLLVPAKQP